VHKRHKKDYNNEVDKFFEKNRINVPIAVYIYTEQSQHSVISPNSS